MSDSEDEGEGGRRNRTSHNGGDVDMAISAQGGGTNGDGTVAQTEAAGSSVREVGAGNTITGFGTIGGVGGLVDATVQAGQAVHVKSTSPRAQSGVIGPTGLLGSTSNAPNNASQGDLIHFKISTDGDNDGDLTMN